VPQILVQWTGYRPSFNLRPGAPTLIGMRRTAWLVYLGLGALATGVYYRLPDLPGAALYVAVGASAVVAIAKGIAWHRPAQRLAWWLIAGGQGLFVVGDALFSVNELILGIEPFPSLADALYLPGYPALAAGLALLAHSRSSRRDWAGVLDAAIIAIGFGLLSWVLVMVPYFQDPSLGMVELLVSLAYPVGDVLLLALAARMATSPGRRTLSFRLLTASLALTMAADTLFAVLALSGADTLVTDGGYLVAYLLLGASALHPSMAGLSEPATRRRARLGRGRLLAMAAAALVAPALLIVQRLQGNDIEVAAIAGTWAVLFVLIMVRMAGLVRGIERSEAERTSLLDRTVQAAEQERTQLAAELHDGPIQRLAVLSYDLERARHQLLGADPVAVARLEQAQAALSTEIQGLRELMVSLRPPALDEVGLEAALRDQVGAFARHTGVNCSVQVALDGRLDGELETIVYRVTQEALLNVARHARARRLWLRLEGVGDRVQLCIQDDGVGFDQVAGPELARSGHFGLVAMRERVEIAGGRFQLDTHPGAGVTLRATFSVPSAA
jgi:signal transduction histidine kinase